ncbi:MAG TPA: FAD:protein FMN transferase [Gaiellaceae bacterium]|jgi:thiamine biosynthesis lipoprotein
MHRVEHIMGMPIVVEVRDGDVTDEVFDWFRHVDATFSTYKEESDVSRIRRGDLALADASEEVRDVYARCAELRQETSGFFDVDAVGLDPSGYVKGWAVDGAAAILDRSGAREYAINAGGDIRTRGRWRIGIQHPLEPQAVATVVEGDDLAVATSGAYERGDHVRDPHSGHAPAGILSVTITGPDLGTADAYATAAFAMGGHRAPNWTARLDGYEAMTILDDGRVLSTPGFPSASRFTFA